MWTEENLLSGFENNGLQDGLFGSMTYGSAWIINSLADVLEWFIGAATYSNRAILVGYTNLVELFINNIVELTTGEEASLTVEDIVNNRVPVFDVNFFNFKNAEGEELKQDSIIYIIRETVAMWYYIIRNIAIIGLLITLIYIGIRMALSTVSEEKAKYKQLLVSWLVSFIITVGIHYVMIFILNINESLISLINATLPGGEESLYDIVRNGSYAIQHSIGWTSTLIYMILVFILIKFVFMYFKRLLVVAILTFMAPIIGVTYSIDKIKDNKSQSLSNWLKEYTFNVMIQSVHALLYALMVSLALSMTGPSVISICMAAFLVGFIFKAEKIFKNIFGIKSGQLSDALKSTAAVVAGGTIAKNIVNSRAKLIGTIAKPISKPIKQLYQGTKEYKKMDIIDQIQDGLNRGSKKIKIGNRTYNVGDIGTKGGNFDSREVATELFSKFEEDAKKDNKFARSLINQTLNTVKGTAQAVVAVPMIFSDSSAGIAMISKARGTLSKGINGSNKEEKYYTGKGRGIKNILTGGIYKNAANVVGQVNKVRKRNNKSGQNTQYEIASKLLTKKINAEYERLYNDNKINVEELNEVMKEVSRTTSTGTIMSITYLINAALDNNIRITVNENGTTQRQKTSIDSESERLAKEVKDLESLQRQVKELAKGAKKNNIKIDHDKFIKTVESEVKKIIAEEKGIRRKEVTQKEIQKKLEQIKEKDKKKMIKEALVKSTKMEEKAEETIEKQKTEMKLENAKEIISMISKKSKVKIDEESYQNDFENLIKTEIAEQSGIDVNSITESDADKYIATITNKELMQKIKEAGAMKNSSKLSKKAQKSEYATLVEYIKQKKYYESKKKGKE